MEEIHLNRQAIHNAHREVIGYELLFQGGPPPTQNPAYAADQSAQLIVNTLMEIGLENLVGSNKAFLNLSHDYFYHAHPIPMASYQVVLEVSGRCLEDAAVYQELHQLAKRGYTLSLYDYEYNEATAERLDCIDIVKLDIAKHDAQSLKEQSRYYRNHGKRLHVSGLQSDAQQVLCSQLGIEFYQGDYIAPCDTLSLPISHCNRQVLQTLSGISPQEQRAHERVVEAISHDPTLCYKLLRYINCASFSGRTEIHNLHQVVDLMGIATLKEWAQLMLTAQSCEHIQPEQGERALIRATMCRDLALMSGSADADTAFLCGLLSTVHEVMAMPQEEVFDAITLSPAITFALLYGEGSLGHTLQQVTHLEQQEWQQLDTSQIPSDEYHSCYQNALQSARRVYS